MPASQSLRSAAGRPEQTPAGLVPAPASSLRELLQKQQKGIERALPSFVKPDRFVRAVLTEMSRIPRLAECTPQSFLGGIMVLAQLGLEPGPLGLAHLLPFRNKGRYEATPIIGYRGYIELARRSGQLLDIQAVAVHENDHFEFAQGLEPKLEHTWDLKQPRGEAYAYYGVAHFKDGGRFFLVMSKSEVRKYRDRSPSARSGAPSPWDTDEDAMSLKTVIRRMEPYLPKATEQLALGFDADEKVVLDYGTGGELVVEEIEDAEVVDAETTPETPPQEAPAAAGEQAPKRRVQRPGEEESSGE